MENFSCPIPFFDLTSYFLSFNIPYQLGDFFGRMILNFLLFYTRLFKFDREVKVGYVLWTSLIDI